MTELEQLEKLWDKLEKKWLKAKPVEKARIMKKAERIYDRIQILKHGRPFTGYKG